MYEHWGMHVSQSNPSNSKEQEARKEISWPLMETWREKIDLFEVEDGMWKE